VSRSLLLLATLVAASPALAESPRYGAFEFSLGGYRPSIDAGVSGKPYQTIFGSGSGLMFRADGAYSIFIDHGTLDVGLGAGYFRKSGKGLFSVTSPAGAAGTPSQDDTAFNIIPTRATITYRYDVLANQYRWFPLVPYARFSLDRYWWWVTNGSGNVANASGKSGSGATNGFSFSGGVALQLDSLDPTLGRDMDRDTGINHTYLFVDFEKSYIKDFGSSKSWDLSYSGGVMISGGMLFVF